MHLYVGTYSGQLIALEDFPQNLHIAKSIQLSPSSIRALHIYNHQLLVGTFDQQFKVIDINTGSEIIDEKQHSGIISKICSFGSSNVVVGTKQGEVRFYDSKNWKIKYSNTQLHKKQIEGFDLDKQQKLLVSASKDKLVFWSTDKLKRIYQYKLPYSIQDLFFTTDFESMFLVGNNEIKQLNTQDNKQLATIKVSQGIQNCIQFQNFIIVTTSLGNVKIWQMNSSYEHCLTYKAHSQRIKVCMALHDEQSDFLITGSSAGVLRVWDILEFLKQVQHISTDYNLEQLKPIQELQLNQRILCMVPYTPNEQQAPIEKPVIQQQKIKNKKNSQHKKQQKKSLQSNEQLIKKKKKIKKSGNKQKVKNKKQFKH